MSELKSPIDHNDIKFGATLFAIKKAKSNSTIKAIKPKLLSKTGIQDEYLQFWEYKDCFFKLEKALSAIHDEMTLDLPF